MTEAEATKFVEELKALYVKNNAFGVVMVAHGDHGELSRYAHIGIGAGHAMDTIRAVGKAISHKFFEGESKSS